MRLEFWPDDEVIYRQLLKVGCVLVCYKLIPVVFIKSTIVLENFLPS